MTCAWCHEPMAYIHGHAACVRSTCPMFGLNQAECCDGETSSTCPTPTSAMAARLESDRGRSVGPSTEKDGSRGM